MKRSFTILTAAIALLTFLAIPMGMKGQTRDTETATSTTMTANVSYQDLETGKLIEYKNSASNSYSNPIRIYANNTFTIHAKEGAERITEISIVANNESYATVTNNATWSASGTGTCSATASVSGKTVTVSITGTATTVTCKPSAQVRWDELSVTYTKAAATTYTITYDCNGGTSGCPTNMTGITPGQSVILADAPTKTHFNFAGWNDGTTTYDAGDSYTVNSSTTFTAQWESDGSGGEGSICFSNQSSCTAINGVSVTGDDNLENTWTITTTGTTSFTANSAFYQVGSGSKPASEIEFTTTLNEAVNITDFSASFGGFSATAGTITLKVDNITVGSGSLNAGNDVTITNSIAAEGTTLTVIVTPTAGGVKCYNISYAYETITPSQAVATTTTITVPSGFNADIHNGTNAGTLTATVTAEGNAISGATVTWSSSNTSVATIDANGAVTLVAVGTTTITANYAGVEDEYRPSSDTYELTVTDSYAPGTVNNPYTVAQARAAIDANTGITGVYVTGIISQVDSYSNNTITYWISDDGTTTNQLEVYKGKNLNNTNFTALSDVEVGATVIVFGTLKKYNEIYEFNSGNYLTSYTAPVHAVEAPTFSPAAGTYAEAQTVTISCATETATIFYTIDGTDPATSNSSTQYVNPITVSSTMTIKAVAVMGQYTSNMATATYHINSQANPYTVAEALAFNEYPANGIYVHGIVSTAASSLSSGTLTYYISDDGTTTAELEVYKGKDLNNEAFTAVDDIQVGDIVTIYGNVQVYNSTIEFGSGNYLVSFERPAQQYNLTVTPSANVEIYTFVGDDPTQEGQAGAFTTQVYDDTTVGISVSAEEGYVLTLIVDGTDVTSQLDETGWYEFTMPAHDVTVTATASLAPVVTTNTYTLATSIESGKQYIIVGKADGNYYAMGYQKSNNRHAVEISIDDNTATATIANTETNAHEFTITSLGEGFYSIEDATTSGGYLYAAGSNANNLKTESTLSDNSRWEMTVDSETGLASVVATESSNRNVMQFNNGSILFACYASASQHPVYLYVKDETPIIETETYTLTINGYGNNTTGGWYLIASPVATTPDQVTNMITDETEAPYSFDLYRFNQNAELEWENYHQHQNDFNIVPGQGYLYANKGNVENTPNEVNLTFIGTPYSGNGEVTLDKSTGVDFEGWNLVGNPFTERAYIGDRSFYVMNDGGEIITAERNYIEPMEGIFVIAEEDGEILTFSTTAPSKASSKLVMNLSNNRGNAIDRAIVRFNEGRQLPKFQLHENSTKLYIPQEGNDYAVVRSESMGEIPVNFKAENNGTYTLTFNNEEVSFNYLHLIDNKTGNNVDLMANPSYTFEANVADYASRFRLVFSANSINEQVENETFAFFNGNAWVINNNGVATLQVIDMSGRVISTETVNGNATTKVNAATGVYMLRLTNGNVVKTQKVVVK